MSAAAIILAAGRGTRAGGDQPKQWQVLAGRRVIDWTLDTFRAMPGIDHIVVVLHADDLALFTPPEGVTVTTGGASRDASVRFAFLLAVPAIAGAGAYETLKLIRHGVAEGVSLGPASAAFVVSLVASWLALIGLIRIIRRFGLWVFSPYCLAIGTAGLIYFV